MDEWEVPEGFRALLVWVGFGCGFMDFGVVFFEVVEGIMGYAGGVFYFFCAYPLKCEWVRGGLCGSV